MSAFSVFAYVTETENEAKDKGLELHKVLTCAFYPEMGKRDFYFSKNSGIEVSLHKAKELLVLKGQRDCIFSMYTKSDKLYSFSKNMGASREMGIALVRESKVIAIAFIEAVYGS